MGCQRDQQAPPRRVQLTDQALVAVALARRIAAERGRAATVADLVLGLVVEPDGPAGHALRGQAGGALGLQARLGAVAPGLPSLEAMVRAAAGAAMPRPPGTLDLLLAAVRHGGPDLGDLLESAGVDAVALRDVAEHPAGGPGGLDGGHSLGWSLFVTLDTTWSHASETVGLRPADDPDPGMAPAAALAVARTRALAGGAVELLFVLAAADESGTLLPIPLWDLADVVDRLHRTGMPEQAVASWDRGLEAVVSAARTWCADRPVAMIDLVRAAATAGGVGPRMVLEEVERRLRREE